MLRHLGKIAWDGSRRVASTARPLRSSSAKLPTVQPSYRLATRSVTFADGPSQIREHCKIARNFVKSFRRAAPTDQMLPPSACYRCRKPGWRCPPGISPLHEASGTRRGWAVHASETRQSTSNTILGRITGDMPSGPWPHPGSSLDLQQSGAPEENDIDSRPREAGTRDIRQWSAPCKGV